MEWICTYDHEEPTTRTFGAIAPWPFILLFIMTFLFFGGGIVLDSLAGQVSVEKIRSLFPDRPPEKKSGEETTSDSALKQDERQSLIQFELIQFEKEKADRLAASARLLYDMAKIALGALLTCLTQMINAVVVSQRRAAAE